ncbi:MAG TPA: SDR family oxidoreductase [Deltaproteobacteria bacterium]|nr:SDR family oxidoreductase [Deltaproteobacteria bacterium]
MKQNSGMEKTILITGASRGIGLELTRQYLTAGCFVVASCRNPGNSDELSGLKHEYRDQLEVLQLDVTSREQLSHLDASLGSRPIDVLYCNAGVLGSKDLQLGTLEAEQWEEVFRVNAIAPIMVAQRMLPRIRKGNDKILAFLTSQLGSIGNNSSGGMYLYRSSKAALNAAVRSLAVDLSQEGIKVVLLHPGWVRTDMGGPNAPVSVEESVMGMRQVVKAIRQDQSGTFFNQSGEVLPW